MLEFIANLHNFVKTTLLREVVFDGDVKDLAMLGKRVVLLNKRIGISTKQNYCPLFHIFVIYFGSVRTSMQFFWRFSRG